MVGSTLELTVLIAGLIPATILLAVIVSSIFRPDRRIWPPVIVTRKLQIFVWILTIAIFSSAFVLGLLDWNKLQLPVAVRWSSGALLIAGGNWVVWKGVAILGLDATSGGVDTLKTGDLYRYSRNPQYMADIAILSGWAILSGSLLTLPVVGAGIIVLLLAPIAEEPWLKQVYGPAYDAYCKQVRRYI